MRQRIKAPEGATSWLKVTIVDSAARRSDLSGAGFSEITIPDVQVTRMLRLPTDAESTDAAAEVVSLHRATDPGGFSPTGTEAGLHRRWTSESAGTYEVKASAVPVPSDELDELLYKVAPEQRNRITATADSTALLGTGLSPRNLTDGNLSTAWIAGDNPTIHLRWPDKQAVGEIVLAPAGGLSTRPTEVNISSPDGSTIAGVDENGVVRFDPITTDRLDITITETAPMTVHNPLADEDLQLPVGLTEAYVPALDQYRTPQPRSTRTFDVPCGEGPTLAVDDELYETSAKGTVQDLVERRPIELTLCQEGRADPELSLGSGSHRVEAGDAGPLAVTDVTLTRGTVTTPTALNRELGIRDWLGDRREVSVGSGAASYLTTYENFNDGWKATLNGKKLDPVRLDGWQQGWRVPAGAGGTVELVRAVHAVRGRADRRRCRGAPARGARAVPAELAQHGRALAGATAARSDPGHGRAHAGRDRDRRVLRAAGASARAARLAAARPAGAHRVPRPRWGRDHRRDRGRGAGLRGRGGIRTHGPTAGADRPVRGVGLGRGGVVRDSSPGGARGPGGGQAFGASGAHGYPGAPGTPPSTPPGTGTPAAPGYPGAPKASALPPPAPGTEAPTEPLPQRRRGESAGPGASESSRAPEAHHGMPGVSGTAGAAGAAGTAGSYGSPGAPTAPGASPTPGTAPEQGAGPAPGEAEAPPAPRVASGPTISARGPGSAQPEPDPPTTRFGFRKPKFRATPPEEPRPERPEAARPADPEDARPARADDPRPARPEETGEGEHT